MDKEDGNLLEVYKNAAKAFILGYTGLTEDELNGYADVTIAYLILINDMSLNRDYTVSKDTVNPAVSTILNLHRVNHIAG